MRNYKEEYELWLDSPNLSQKEWEELKSIAGDEKGDRKPLFRPA